MKGFVVSAVCWGVMVNSGLAAAQIQKIETRGWKQGDFIVTMWCDPPATEETFARLAREGYSLYTTSSVDSPALAVNLLDMARKHGLKVLLRSSLVSPDTLDDPAQKAKLGEFVDRVKKHPALEGYYLTDEPSATTFPNWARLVKYLKDRDPDHLAYINLYPTYANQQQLGVFLKEPPKGPLGIPDNFAGIGTKKETLVFYNEHLRQYIAQVKPELISYDHYHFMRNNDGLQYFLNLELIRTAALKASLPFLNIVQACTIEKSWRLPEKNELRWLAYTTLAYGARGISWFLYWGPVSYGGMYQDGKRMPHADWVAEINQDIKALGPELMKLRSTQVYHTTPLPIGTQGLAGCPVQAAGGQYVIGMFKEGRGTDAFMIMNRDYKAASTAQLTLDLGKGVLMEFSIAHRKWVEIKPIRPGSVVDVELIPGGGKLFKVRKPGSPRN